MVAECSVLKISVIWKNYPISSEVIMLIWVIINNVEIIVAESCRFSTLCWCNVELNGVLGFVRKQ